MKTIRVGLLGIGTVGAGTFRILQRNRELIAARAGGVIEVAMVAARNIGRARSIVGEAVRVTADAMEVVCDPGVDVVVEAIGGCTVARELVMQAIANGKHVVTANKALLAEHGNEIFDAAREKGVIVAYEGAVAVSIPIIKMLREGLTANRIEWVAGILNGTTNFILSEMREKGLEFGTVLKEAQRLGYAEADPRFDVEGVDAAHKLTIIAALAFGMPLRFADVHVEGISGLDARDVGYAESFGYRVKLLGIARRSQSGVELRVHPALVPAGRLIASVEGSMNGILVCGDAVGVTMYTGAGAGSEETGAAVVADLVDIARSACAPAGARVPGLAFQPQAVADLPVLPMSEVRTRHYLRVCLVDGAAAHVLSILAAAAIAVEAMHQAPSEEGGVDLLLLTMEAAEGNVALAVAGIASMPGVRSVVRIRVEELA